MFVFYHPIFPECIGNVSTQMKYCDGGVGITWSLWLRAAASHGVNQANFFGDGSSCPGAQSVMSLFIIPQPVSVICSWLDVRLLASGADALIYLSSCSVPEQGAGCYVIVFCFGP